MFFAARKTFLKSQGRARSAEVIGDFNIEQQEGQDGSKHRQNGLNLHLLEEMPRRGEKPGAGKAGRDHQAVGVEIPVENRDLGARTPLPSR